MKMTRLEAVLGAAVVFLLLAGAGCGDDGGTQGIAPTMTTATDATTGDTSEPADTAPPEDTMPLLPDTTPAGPGSLSYAGTMYGADGLPCTTHCTLAGDAGEEFELAVRYTDAKGSPQVDKSVRFATDAPGALALLSSLSAFTDDQGVARVTLRTGDLAGTAVVTASVSSDAEAGERTFVANLALPPQPVLVVSAEYVGEAAVGDFSLRLFRQDAGGSPSCGAVHPDAGGTALTATLARTVPIGEQAKFTDLPGLAESTEQRWTAQWLGPATGTPLAVGCADDIVVRPMQTTSKLIYVLDLPPNFRGTFDVVSPVDMLSGAEGTAVGNIMGGIVGMFTDPGEVLLVWACDNASGFLDTLCGWLVTDDGQLKVAGEVAASFIKAGFDALVTETLGANVQVSGETISQLLRELRFVSTLQLDAEPSTPKPGFEGAYFASALETWTHVRFRWEYDPACKNVRNPSECGWTSIPLADVYCSPTPQPNCPNPQSPQASPSVGVTTGTELVVDPHTVSRLEYGPLVNAILEWRILPLMFGDGSDDLPPIDSWDDLVSTVFGDSYCLYYDDCCEYFAQRIEDDVPSYVAAYAPDACELAIPLLANLIRDRISGLRGPMRVGTPANAPCQGGDLSQDRWIDAYGGVNDMCEWDMSFQLNSGASFSPDALWRAVRQ